MIRMYNLGSEIPLKGLTIQYKWISNTCNTLLSDSRIIISWNQKFIEVLSLSVDHALLRLKLRFIFR